jgi:hypothetical protein
VAGQLVITEARDEDATTAETSLLPRWPWICGHAIRAGAATCDCGARRAVLTGDVQPVIPGITRTGSSG